MKLVAGLVLGIALALPFAAQAEDLTARRVLAQQVVALTTGEAIGQSTIAAVWPGVEATITAKNPNLPPDAMPALKQVFATSTMQMMSGVASTMVELYALEYSLEELEALKAFYESPAGRKSIAIAPRIASEVMPKVISETQGMFPRLLEEFASAAQRQGFRVSI